MPNMRVLVVDDDANIRQLIKLYLNKENIDAEEAANGEQALDMFRQNPPQLILLDIMMSGTDGLQVCRTIRQLSNIPIIMITARENTFDKVLGLELGADDYITKPFEPKELVARVKAVMRRAQTPVQPEQEVAFPNLLINRTNYEVTYCGEKLALPPKAIELLYFLASHRNKVFTREQLLEQVWGFDYYGDSRTVDVHVRRLREKLTGSEEYGWQIKTVWSVGYKFEVK